MPIRDRSREPLLKLLPDLPLLDTLNPGIKHQRVQRREILRRLALLKRLVSGASTFEAFQTALATERTRVQDIYTENVRAILDRMRPLERNYRGIDVMFTTRKSKGIDRKNVYFINATADQLGNPKAEGYRLIDELLRKKNYDKYDKRDSVALLALPGYLLAHDAAGKVIDSKDVISLYATLAARYKVLVVTDYEDYTTEADLVRNFRQEKIAGPQEEKRRILMFCNWLKVRGAYSEYGEDEPLFAPPSLAVIGRMLANKWCATAAGLRDGSLQGVYGLRLTLGRDTAESMREEGLIPIWHDFGAYYAHSEYSLHTGDIRDRVYPVTRTFDTIDKKFQEIVGKYRFRTIVDSTMNQLREEIGAYLRSLNDEYIDTWGWEGTGISHNENRVDIAVQVKPLYPAADIRVFLFHAAEDSEKPEQKNFSSNLKPMNQ